MIQRVPEPGSKWKDARDVVEVVTAAWNRVVFTRNGVECILPGALFHKRFELVQEAPRGAANMDHPLIARFLALRGRQPTTASI